MADTPEESTEAPAPEVRTEALKITSFIKTFNDAIELLVIKPLNSAKQVL